MWNGNIIRVDVIRRFRSRDVWSEMTYDLMSVQIEVDPKFRASTLFTFKNASVEFASSVKIVNRKCEVEKILHG